LAFLDGSRPEIKKKEQLLPRCRNLPVFKETLGQTSKHREIFEIFARFD
jgi:UDP-N-acetylglucosamine 2-epimerase